jgi:hypothetical protein
MPAAESPGQDPEDELTDDELESEIELVSELVVAATSSDGPLGQDELDNILGVSPKVDGPATET